MDIFVKYLQSNWRSEPPDRGDHTASIVPIFLCTISSDIFVKTLIFSYQMNLEYTFHY